MAAETPLHDRRQERRRGRRDVLDAEVTQTEDTAAQLEVELADPGEFIGRLLLDADVPVIVGQESARARERGARRKASAEAEHKLPAQRDEIARLTASLGEAAEPEPAAVDDETPAPERRRKKLMGKRDRLAAEIEAFTRTAAAYELSLKQQGQLASELRYLVGVMTNDCGRRRKWFVNERARVERLRLEVERLDAAIVEGR